MKNKAPLTLMEQLIMVLVFALAAALCLQAFVLADRTSNRCKARDHAVTLAQNTAETLKFNHGDLLAMAADGGTLIDADCLQYTYDENWQSSDNAVYRLEIRLNDSILENLGSAEVSVTEANGEALCTLSTAWQEVGA